MRHNLKQALWLQNEDNRHYHAQLKSDTLGYALSLISYHTMNNENRKGDTMSLNRTLYPKTAKSIRLGSYGGINDTKSRSKTRNLPTQRN